MLHQISTHPETGRGPHRVAMVVLVKLSLIAAVLALLYFGGGLLNAGLSILMLHAIAAVVLVAVLILGGSRHGVLSRAVERAENGNDGPGIILHGAIGYDLLVQWLTLGRERELRERMLKQAHLQTGESVLDAACGTGTLAIYAKKLVGAEGQVFGIDASHGMIERARKKAERAGVGVSFIEAFAQALPFDDGQFDVVVGTLMLHHLSKPLRRDFVGEARRVLKGDGRLVLIDFNRSHQSRFRLHRHGHVDRDAAVEMLTESGFRISDVGDLGMKDLIYFVAKPVSGQER